MLTLQKKIITLSLYFLVAHTTNCTSSYFSFRSASRNSARHYAVWQTPAEQNAQKVTGKIGLIGQWSANFKKNNIAECLFGGLSCNKNENLQLEFSGSLSENRSSNAFLADYFYLPTDFKSTAVVNPSVKMFIVSPVFRLNLDAWHKGLYCEINSSFVHMHTNVHFKETVVEPGINSYKEGYFVADDSLIRTKLLENATAYFAGNSIQNDSATVFEALNFGRVTCEYQKRNGMADTSISFGYDHLFENRSSIGVAGHLGLPTGNRVHGRTLLEPTVGNGHHWELGGSINGHYTVWKNDESQRTLSFVGDIYLGHLFRCEQTRVFDLVDRPLSRYMLAMEFEAITPSENTLETSSSPGSPTGSIVPFQFAQHYMPLANATALAVDVSASIQADIVGMINFTAKQWSLNIGCNVWCKTKDKLSFSTPPVFNVALKGDAQMYGYVDDTDTPIVLSATQSKATAFSGLRFTKGSNPVDLSVLQNNAIDNPGIAVVQDLSNDVVAPETTGLTYAPNLAADTDTFIKTSNLPVFVTMNDLDIDGATTSSSSCKLFYNAQYAINTTSSWKPTIGLGGEVEWGHQSSHKKSAFSQWSIWAHCSFGF